MAFLRKVFFTGIILAICYGLLGFHYIFFSARDFGILKKSHLTLNYTFFNAAGKTPHEILENAPLRHDGIGDMLVERGIINQETEQKLLNKFDEEENN